MNEETTISRDTSSSTTFFGYVARTVDTSESLASSLTITAEEEEYFQLETHMF